MHNTSSLWYETPVYLRVLAFHDLLESLPVAKVGACVLQSRETGDDGEAHKTVLKTCAPWTQDMSWSGEVKLLCSTTLVVTALTTMGKFNNGFFFSSFVM